MNAGYLTLRDTQPYIYRALLLLHRPLQEFGLRHFPHPYPRVVALVGLAVFPEDRVVPYFVLHSDHLADVLTCLFRLVGQRLWTVFHIASAVGDEVAPAMGADFYNITLDDNLH
jgi:hypothetical protein